MAEAADGAGLRQRGDRLATLARLAGGGRVAGAAPGAAGPPRRGRAHRLVARQRGQRQRAGERGGQATGPNPTDRAKPGTKHHLVVDRHGLPLACGITGANRPDHTVFAALIAALPPIKQPNGRRRKRPLKLHADKGYAYPACRRFLRQRGIRCRIARKGIERADRLGRHRWVVERTLAWLHHFRRLAVRHERRDDLHQAFLDLGCALLCLRALHRSEAL